MTKITFRDIFEILKVTLSKNKPQFFCHETSVTNITTCEKFVKNSQLFLTFQYVYF